MPGHGRRIDGRGALRVLEDELGFALQHSVLLPPTPATPPRRAHDYLQSGELLAHVDLNHNTAYLRRYVTRQLRGVAFIADGSCLPRARGNSVLPLHAEGAQASEGDGHDGVVFFQSPPSLRVTVELPNAVAAVGRHAGCQGGYHVRGMLLPRGLTLIAGGGYHGKSTLLHALSTAVYNAAAMDGRSYCVTDDMAVAVRAEEGRSVRQLDVSLFLESLPSLPSTNPHPSLDDNNNSNKRESTNFSTEDASGSTSEAAAILEALELGARTLLLDEDSSASNLLVRDARMAALVPRAAEPIRTLREQLPFVKYQQSNNNNNSNHTHHQGEEENNGLSLVMVVGGSGSYFDMADVVLVLDCYRVRDATADAHAIAAATSLTAENEHIRQKDNHNNNKKKNEKRIDLSLYNATRAFDYAGTFAPFLSAATTATNRQGTNPDESQKQPFLSKGEYYKNKYVKSRLPPSPAAPHAVAPVKITAHRCDALQLTGRSHTRTTTTEVVDVAALGQLVEDGQLTAIAAGVGLLYDTRGQLQWPPPSPKQERQTYGYPPSLTTAAAAPFHLPPHVRSPFARLLYALEAQLRVHALEPPRPFHSSNDHGGGAGGYPLARGAAVLPRVVELAAVVNRLRCLRCRR